MGEFKRARLDLNEDGGPNLGGGGESGDGLLCRNVDCTNLKELVDGYKLVLNVHRRVLTAPTSERDSVMTKQNIDIGLLKKFWAKRCPRACARASLNEFVHACATYPSPETFHQVIMVLKDDESLADLMKEKGVAGATPLHISVHHMQVNEKTLEVLKSKVGINDLDDKGDNVLSYAVQGGRDEAYLKLLLGLGAEPGINNDGASLALQAVKVGNVHGIKLFGPMDDIYPETAEESWLQKVFCEYGANLSSQAIHETVKALVNMNKALVLLLDEEGRVPLWFAKNGLFKDKVSAETVELLMNCSKEEYSKLKKNVRESQSQVPLTHETGTQCEATTMEAVNHERVIKNEVSSDEEDMSNAGQESGVSFECEEVNLVANPEDEGDLDVSSEGEDGDKSDVDSKCEDEIANEGAMEPASSHQAFSQSNLESPPECQPRTRISLRRRKSNKVAGDSDVSSDSEDENSDWKCDEESDVCSVCNGDESENEPASSPPACARCSGKQPPKCPPRRSLRKRSEKRGLSEEEQIDRIHTIISDTAHCKRKELQVKKNELKEILQTNPDLVNKGVGIDLQPLLYEKVHVDLLLCLVEKGADVTATEDEDTVLHKAAEYLDPQDFHRLVLAIQEKNRDVLKQQNEKGVLALHRAVWRMELTKATLNVFKKCNVDMNACDRQGHNLFTYALRGRRSLAFMQLLSELGVKPVKDKKGVTLVHRAAMRSSLEVMNYMIKLSPEDVMALDGDNLSPLHYAIRGKPLQEDNVEKTRALLYDYKVKDHLKADNMRNLLHDVVNESNGANREEIDRKKEVLEMLIKCDPSLLHAEVRDKENRTPLECDKVHLELIKYLLEKGSDPRHRWGANNENYVFLHGMAHLSPDDYHKLIEFMMSKGIGDVIRMKGAGERTPIHDAVKLVELKVGTIQIFETSGGLIDEAGNGWNTLMFAVAGGRSLQFVKILEDKGVPVKSAKDGTTVVHIAAKSGRKEVFDYFLQKSGNPVEMARKRNKMGDTPLHFALVGANGDGTRLEIVKDLLDKYRFKTILNSSLELFSTVLMLCTGNTKKKGRAEIRERVEILKLLLQSVRSSLIVSVNEKEKGNVEEFFTNVHPDIMKELRAAGVSGLSSGNAE